MAEKEPPTADIGDDELGIPPPVPPPSENAGILSEETRTSETASLLTDAATKEVNEGEKSTEQEPAIDFLNDDPSQMTLSRRIALYLMNRYKWYNPRLGKEGEQDDESEKEAYVSGNVDRVINDGMMEYDDEKIIRKENPSLEQAWAYFEHVVLPRYLYKPEDDTSKKEEESMDRASPGEDTVETRLYHPIMTPQKQLGDWGLGIGLYFATLRGLFILIVLAGLINIPNLLYFSSEGYSEGQQGLRLQFKGSAICTDTRWVPCPDCDPTMFPDDRIADAVTDDYNPNINRTFVLKNDCNGTNYTTGFVNYGTFFFIVIGKLLLNNYLEKMEVQFDEDEQTAQDYSIVIEDPPADAVDPEEWKQFIEDNFPGVHVTVCTVAVGNEMLLSYLVQRREALNALKLKLEPGTSLDNITLAGICAKEQRDRSYLTTVFNKLISPGIPELFNQLVICETNIRGLAQLDYPAVNVFMSFETEEGQREVLSELSRGEIDALTDNKATLNNPKYLFRGEHVLLIREAEEPDVINWKDLNWPVLERLKRRIITALVTLGCIVGGFIVVLLLNEGNSKYLAVYAIAILNALFPFIANKLTQLELYPYRSSELTSLYVKLTAFRWVNTAFVFHIVVPFQYTIMDLDDGLIEKVGALFWAEIVVSNLLQLANLPGQIKRNLVAPRAPTQDAMNSNMKGAEFPLADCYTNMTKIVFLAQFYCAIFPTAFFICAIALILMLFVQKQALTRTWAAPKFGAAISRTNRRFFVITSVIMSFFSALYWSGFPFDDLCEVDGSVVDPWYLPGGKNSSWTVQPMQDDSSPVSNVKVNRKDPYYEYCSQEFFVIGNTRFPFVSESQGESKWMTEEQELVTDVYGWTVVAILTVFAIYVIWGCKDYIVKFLRGDYEAVGESQGINFSDVPSMTTYIPQVESNSFSYPLLAVDVRNIDENLIEWKDPHRPHTFYDLTRDAKNLLRGVKTCDDNCFSRISYWPPEGRRKDKLASFRRSASSTSTHATDTNSIGAL